MIPGGGSAAFYSSIPSGAGTVAGAGAGMSVAGPLIGGAIQLVGGLIGGSKSASAARKQAEAQNRAAEAKLYYDTQLWEMGIEKLHANRDFAVKEIEAMARNEGRSAAFADATNATKYVYDLMIRNRQQHANEQQYIRSNDIYHKQLSLNALSAQAGVQDELRQLREIHSEAQFNSQDAYVESIIESGKMRARGVSGRTAHKTGMSTYADYGRRMAMVDESLDAAGRNSRAVLQEIMRDKASADLAAWAQKMLDPGVLPMPILPYETPMAEYIMPRAIEKFDYGPRPVSGAYADPGAAANRAWGTAITGIAGTLGNMAASIFSS